MKYERKKRKAATKALDKIRNSLNIVENPKPKFKYGWLEHDQDYEDDFITTYSHPIPHDNDDSSLASTQPSPEDTDATDSATSDSSNVDLVWDTSPIQYSLQASEDTLPNQVHNRPLQPLMSTSKELPPSFPRTRNRIDASTRPPLTRRHAFRSPRYDQAFLKTPTEDATPYRMTYYYPSTSRGAPRKRVHKPSSPSHVRLNEVNDLSLLPHLDQQPLRRSSRIPRPRFLYTEEKSQEEEEEEEDRRTPRKR